MGHMIGDGEMNIDPSKVEVIMKWQKSYSNVETQLYWRSPVHLEICEVIFNVWFPHYMLSWVMARKSTWGRNNF